MAHIGGEAASSRGPPAADSRPALALGPRSARPPGTGVTPAYPRDVLCGAYMPGAWLCHSSLMAVGRISSPKKPAAAPGELRYRALSDLAGFIKHQTPPPPPPPCPCPLPCGLPMPCLVLWLIRAPPPPWPATRIHTGEKSEKREARSPTAHWPLPLATGPTPHNPQVPALR
jgi:hypothetical protein